MQTTRDPIFSVQIQQRLGQLLLVGALLIGGGQLVTYVALARAALAPNACTIVANPTPSNFTNCPGANLDAQDFSGGKNLSYANFSGASLQQADLSDAILTEANLSGANFREADVSGATLVRANLSNANLTVTDISLSNLSGANLIGVIWSNTTCVDATISDNNGNTCVGHLLLPTIVPSAIKANNTPYVSGAWSNQNVTVHFACTAAAGRTIATCTPDQTYSTDGAFSKEGTATDNSGFFSTATFGPIQIDKTAPTISASAAKADNSAYTASSWSNQTVTVHFTCSDSGSGLAGACPAAQTISAEGTTPAVNGTATDNAGNSANASFGPIQLDQTKPTITGQRTPAANSNGWNNSDVTVSFTCADNQNGAGLATNTVVGATVSSEGANQAVVNSGQCSDNAGNSADTATVSPINLDKQAPDTIITNQPDDPSPLVATFTFTGTDALAGVSGFQCSLDGAPFAACTSAQHYDALSAGQHTFRVQASDAADNVDATPAVYTWTASGDLPVAFDQTVTTAEESPLAITLQATGKTTVTYSLVSGPAHGVLSGAPPAVVYTPTLNFNGTDSFVFRANDGQFNSNRATITIQVTPVNDPPVINQAPLTVAEDTPLTLTLGVEDVDGDVLTYTLLKAPAHGALSGTLPKVTYTPAANFNGNDSFTFTVSDGAQQQARSTTATVAGSVNITITAVNDAPVAEEQTVTTPPGTALNLTLQGTDAEGDALTYTVGTPPQHGVLSGSAPNLVYIPAANFQGNDELTFQVSDGQTPSNLARIRIKVTDKPLGLFLAIIRR